MTRDMLVPEELDVEQLIFMSIKNLPIPGHKEQMWVP